MPQFLIDKSNIHNNTATITGGDAKHINTVLRLKVGDWLVLTDGEGHRWRAEIISSSPKKVEARLTNELTHQRTNAQVVLAQAMIKHDRFEWIIQKSVELGCSRIIPFTSDRTIPKFNKTKSARWQKIADEAAKQCGTSIRPVVEEPVPFIKLLDQSNSAVLFYEGEANTTIKSYQRTNELTHQRTIIIGPEGGFSAEEIAAAKKAGVVTCSLGPLIMRVETAAVAALTLIQYKLGHFNETPIKHNTVYGL